MLKNKNQNTDWGNVADWYHNNVKDDDSYQKQVIRPNILRLLGDLSGKTILDIACGEGVFSRAFLEQKADKIIAFDLGKNLIDIAKKEAEKIKQNKIENQKDILIKKEININKENKKDIKVDKIKYFIANAENFKEKISKEDREVKEIFEKQKIDIAVCISAIQNIENIKKMFLEINQVLNKNGKVYIILNHPVLRNPKHSSWGFDVEKDIEYRRIDEYLSSSKIEIDMSPSKGEKEKNKQDRYTISFHRSLQEYFKIFKNTGFAVSNLEEWISHRKSEGKREKAENKSKKEFPLFMCYELIKINN